MNRKKYQKEFKYFQENQWELKKISDLLFLKEKQQ